MEGLYSGLSSGAALSSTQLDVKMKLLVEAPAAVEDALASLLDHHDATLQVGIGRLELGRPAGLIESQDGVQPARGACQLRCSRTLLSQRHCVPFTCRISPWLCLC